MFCIFFFSSRRRHTRLVSDWSSDVCSSDLKNEVVCNKLKLCRRRRRQSNNALDPVTGGGPQRIVFQKSECAIRIQNRFHTGDLTLLCTRKRAAKIERGAVGRHRR